MDLGFHLALSYRDLEHPTSRQNFANVMGQNHALILTQCPIVIENTSADLVPPQDCVRLQDKGQQGLASQGSQECLL